MDLSNIVATDLNENNIGTFLSEFDNALANGDYAKLRDAIERINDFLVAGKIIVSSGRSNNQPGRNYIEVTDGTNTEQIFVDDIADHVVGKVKADYTANPGANTDRDAVRSELNKNLTAIFNQNRLLETLANRGFSIDEFKKQADKANDESKRKIDNLRAQQKKQVEKFEDTFGKNTTITSGDYTTKSSITRIKTCKDGIAIVELAKDRFDKIQDLKAKIIADPSKKSEYEAQIAQLQENMKYLGKKILDCNFPGLDKDMIKDWETKPAMFSRTFSIIKVHIATTLSSEYENLKNVVAGLQPADLIELGISPEIKSKFDGVMDPDDSVSAAARDAVDKYLIGKQRSLTQGIDNEIATEERLMQLRKENVAHYEELTKRINDSKVRLKTGQCRPKRKRDTNGNYIVVNGRYELDIDPSTGNPYTEEVMDIPTDVATRQEFLQKARYDESKELIAIDAKYESRAAKRHALEVLNIGNRFTRFFAPGRLWKKYNARRKILASREESAIELQMRKDYEEIVPDIAERFKIEQLFSRIKQSAAIQHTLYSAGKEQGWDADSVDKSKLVDDLERAAYEETLYRAGTVALNEITDIRKKKGYTHESVVDKNNKQVINNDLLHEDENNDMEL